MSGTATCGSNGTAGNSVSYTNASLVPGSTLTLTVSGTIASGASGPILNSVTVAAGAGSTDTSTGNNTASDTDTQAAGVADLVITKSDGQASYTAGTPITYTVTVTNAGPSNANGFDIADVLPASITGVGVSCATTGTASCGANASSGNNLSFTGAMLAAGAGHAVTLTITGTVSPSATGTLVNTAQAFVPGSANYNDPNLGNNSATDTDAAGNPQVDLTITKTDGQASYVPGAAITYTLVVTNAGPSMATGVSIADALPAGFSGVTASCAVVGLGSCGTNTSAGTNISFTNASLAPGATNTLTITIIGTVSPNRTGDLINTATVSAGPGATEANAADNSATDTDTQGAGEVDLAISKTNGQAGYIAGTAVTYTVTVTNLGPSHAPGFEIHDTVPPMIGGVAVSCSATGTATCGTNGSSGNTIAFTGASLNAGAGNSLTLTITGTIDPAFTSSNIVNTAQVVVPTGAGYSDVNLGNNSATDTDTPLPQQVDLSITKDDGQASYVPGTAVTYTVTVTNAGPSTATSVNITDIVPAGIMGVSAICVASGAANCGSYATSSNNVSFTNATIPPGAGHQLTLTITGTISPDTSGSLANTATVTAGPGATETNAANNTATDTDTEGGHIADLTVTKTDGTAIYTAGTAIAYQIVVSNPGPSHAVGFSIADAIPSSLTGVSVTCAVSSGVGACGANSTAGNNLAFTGASLNAGGALTLTVTGTINPSATGDLVNTVNLTVPGGASFTDPNTANNGATDTDTATAQTIDLAIAKDDGAATYVPGAPITYTIVVSNSGPSTATGFTVADVVPANVTGVTVSCVASGSSNCGSNESGGNSVLFSNATLVPSDTLTFTVSGTVSPNATGNLVNTATVTAGAGANEANTMNNNVTDTDTPAASQVDLAVVKTDAQTTYVPGMAISYTITVTNAGPSTATGFSLADTVPASITGVTVTCSVTGAGACGTDGSSGNTIAFTNLGLEPGPASSLTFLVNGTVGSATAGSIVNTATVTAGAGSTDTNAGNNTSPDTNAAGISQVDLGITKTDGQASYVPGTPISYTIVVTNSGPSLASGVSIADAVSSAITGLSVNCATAGTATCGTNATAGNNVSFTGASIGAGAGNSLTFTVSGVVDPSATGTISNSATVSAGAGSSDTNAANNTATDSDTQATAQVDLGITKTDGQATYVPGNPVSYSIVVTNSGPSTASGVSIVDTVPGAIAGVTVNCTPTGTALCGTNGSSGNNVSFTNASLAPGSQLLITVSGTVNSSASGTIINTAAVSAGAGSSDTNAANNTATDTDTQGTSQVDLSITKTDGQATYVPGTALTYTVTVTNAGPSTATGVSIADTVPAAITGVTVSCAVTGTATCGVNGSSGNTVSFTGVSVAPGSQVTLTINGTTNPNATGSIANTATATAGAGSTDTIPANNSATDTDTQATPEVDLSITKTNGQTAYVPGTTTSYTIVVSNAGPSDATGVAIADVVPADITGVIVSCAAAGTSSCGTNATAGNNVSFTGATVRPGAGNAVTLTVNGTIDPAASGSIANTATVTASGGNTETAPANNSVTDTDTLSGAQVDLAVTKTNGQTTYIPGTVVTYTIVVTNGGPSLATGVSIADTVPASITGVTASCVAAGTASCGTNASSGNNVSFTGASVPPAAGNTLTLTVSGTVDPAATAAIVNTATVAAGGGATDPTPANNTATDTDSSGVPQIDLVVAKTDGQATYVPGSPITYTITVRNNGPSQATGFSLVDLVPANITGVTAACTWVGFGSCGTNASAGNNVSFTNLVLAPGAVNALTFTLTGTVSPDATGNLMNTATVAAPAGTNDTDLGNNTATDTDTQGEGLADLAITKTNGQAGYVAGTAVTYTITVRNHGPSHAPSFNVDDVVPSAITGVSVSCIAAGAASCGSDASSGNTVSLTGTSLNAGAGNTLTITVSGTVAPGFSSGNIVNMAQVTVPSGLGYSDPVTGNNTALDTDTPLPQQVDMVITKTDGTFFYTPGAPITYTLVVTNNGPSTASSVTVDDNVPGAITGVTASCVATGVAYCGSDATTGNIVRFTNGLVAPGAGNRLTVTISGRVSPNMSGDLTNQATVSPVGATELALGSNIATDTDNEGPSLADLVVTKTDGAPSYVAGSPITYQVVVRNNGPSHAVDFEVRDLVPPSITGVTSTCVLLSGAGGCGNDESFGTNNVRWFPAALEAGSALLLTIQGTIDPSATGDLTNTGTVFIFGTFSDPDPANNSATDTNTAGAQTMDLGVTLDNGQTSYVPGTPMTYTVRVTNGGPSTATGFSLNAAMPSAFAVTSVTCTPTGLSSCGSDSSSGSNVLFTNATLVPSDELVLTIAGTVAPNATGPLAASAAVTAGYGSIDVNPANDIAAETDPQAPPQVNLVVTKTDGQATYVPGRPVTYTVTVVNIGLSTANGFTLNDTLSHALSGMTVTCAVTGTGTCGSYAIAGNTITFSGLNLDPSAANRLTITVGGTVSPSATGDLVNTATASPGAGATETSPGDNTASDIDVLGTAQVDLIVTKTDGLTSYVPGLPVTYTITVTNAGLSSAPDFSVTDIVPTTITGVTVACGLTGTGSCGANTSAGNTVAFTGASLAAGAGHALTITVSGTVSPSATTTLDNTVTVNPGAGSVDGNPANNSATDSDTAGTPIADLSVNKVGPPTAILGTTLTYTLTVANAGPSTAPTATLTDPTPPGLTLVSISGACTTLPCTLTNIVPGETRTITVRYALPRIYTGPPTIVNTATVTSSTADPTASNSSSSASAPVGSGQTCDVNGDGISELITGAGAGGGPHVRVWDVAAPFATELTGFYAYSPYFTGGTTVACADITGDGLAEIITGAGPGGGPHVRAWQYTPVGQTVTELTGFFAYSPYFTGGTRVAAADVTGDGVAEIITGAGPGGGPHVRVWQYVAATQTVSEFTGFWGDAPNVPTGMFVGAGDVDGDGVAEIVTGPGTGSEPYVRVWSVASGQYQLRAQFYAYHPAFPGGATVATGDLDGDGVAEVITGAGSGGGPARPRMAHQRRHRHRGLRLLRLLAVLRRRHDRGGRRHGRRRHRRTDHRRRSGRRPARPRVEADQRGDHRSHGLVCVSSGVPRRDIRGEIGVGGSFQLPAIRKIVTARSGKLAGSW